MTNGAILAQSIIAFGILSGLYVLIFKQRWKVSTSFISVGTSIVLNTRELGCLRLTIAAYAAFISHGHFVSAATFFPLNFYTVWNWYLLTAYFVLGGVCSLVSWFRSEGTELQEGYIKQSQKTLQEQLEFRNDDDNTAQNGSTHQQGIFRKILPQLVQMCLHVLLTTLPIINVVFWVVLVPVLTNLPDSDQAQMFKDICFSFWSYNMHGLNAVFLLLDLYLSEIQFSWYWLGHTALWASAYGVYTQINYAWTGKWLYFFLDYNQPYGYVPYAGLLVAHFMCYVTVWLVFKLRNQIKYTLPYPLDGQKQE